MCIRDSAHTHTQTRARVHSHAHAYSGVPEALLGGCPGWQMGNVKHRQLRIGVRVALSESYPPCSDGVREGLVRKRMCSGVEACKQNVPCPPRPEDLCREGVFGNGGGFGPWKPRMNQQLKVAQVRFKAWMSQKGYTCQSSAWTTNL
eukprot:9816852-Alexandrium_andersonii.AAC.1